MLTMELAQVWTLGQEIGPVLFGSLDQAISLLILSIVGVHNCRYNSCIFDTPISSEQWHHVLDGGNGVVNRKYKDYVYGRC